MCRTLRFELCLRIRSLEEPQLFPRELELLMGVRIHKITSIIPLGRCRRSVARKLDRDANGVVLDHSAPVQRFLAADTLTAPVFRWHRTTFSINMINGPESWMNCFAMNRNDFKELAEVRIEEANALFAAGKYDAPFIWPAMQSSVH